MAGATMGDYLEMLLVIKFVLDTKKLCLKIKPKIDDAKLELKGLL